MLDQSGLCQDSLYLSGKKGKPEELRVKAPQHLLYLLLWINYIIFIFYFFLFFIYLFFKFYFIF